MAKNVIFISIDNLRFDCVGFQPDKRELAKQDVLKYLETPTLDALAGKSLCFTQCISTNTYTTASHASIFTGLYPPRHGVRAFYETRLSSEVVTLAQTLNRNGYRTVLHSDSPELFVPLGLGRGFEFKMTRNDDKLFDLLKDLGHDRVFLFIHVMDVHEPFLHNANDFRPGINEDFRDELLGLCLRHNISGFNDRGAGDVEIWNRLLRGPLSGRPMEVLFPLYVRGITKFDKGRFHCMMENLEKTGLLKDALTVVFSDHGEGRCSHENKEFFSHGGGLYDNVIRVPLMISHPGIREGISGKLVSTVDIMPTVLSLLDIDVPEDIDGLNVLSESREMAYAEFWEATAEVCPTPDGIRPYNGDKWPDSMLREMAVRTDGQKFVKWNKGNTGRLLGEDIRRLSDEEYVRRLYEDILGRFAVHEELRSKTGALESKAISREEMLSAFLNSEEYKSMPARSYYDLKEDVEEDFPQDAAGNAEAAAFFDHMERLDSRAVVTEKIFAETDAPGVYAPETMLPPKRKEAAKALAPGRLSPGSGEDRSIQFKSLPEKEQRSVEIIRETVGLYGLEKVGCAWTGGKDSTTLLHLIRRAFEGHIPFVVVNLDTSVKPPEIYKFRDELHREWGFDLRIFSNEDPARWLKESGDHAECCHQLKTIPLNRAIETLGLKALFTGLRWDEQEARTDERYFSPRENPAHVRVQPILHFREVDIWQYIKKYGIPYCELYNRGYRSLGCAPCTSLSTGRHERSGRAPEKETIMAKLRELGYF